MEVLGWREVYKKQIKKHLISDQKQCKACNNVTTSLKCYQSKSISIENLQKYKQNKDTFSKQELRKFKYKKNGTTLNIKDLKKNTANGN